MIRLEEEDRVTLNTIAEATGVPPAALTRLALQALLREYRLNASIILPLRVRIEAGYTTPAPGGRSWLMNEAPIPPMGADYGPAPAHARAAPQGPSLAQT